LFADTHVFSNIGVRKVVAMEFRLYAVGGSNVADLCVTDVGWKRAVLSGLFRDRFSPRYSWVLAPKSTFSCLTTLECVMLCVKLHLRHKRTKRHVRLSIVSVRGVHLMGGRNAMLR